MNAAKLIIPLGLAIVLGIPLIVRPNRVASQEDAARVIIVTPHNEQIRFEFARTFDLWHQRNYNQPATVIWSTPGGTAEIRKLLKAQFTAELVQGDGTNLGGNFDLMFGGGTYEHTQLTKPITVEVDGEQRSTTISMPVEFDQEWLDSVYGENRIGDGGLYDPDKYWFGTALSGFGIVYNRDALAQANVDEPVNWADLCHPNLRGWVALVNPGQSGSITTTFEAIIHQRGWIEGWRILRRAGANSRYFSNSSPKVPIDVSRGDAAAGMCIDFYGRFQAQAIKESGDGDRVGYVDPPGETVIDADPISMLRGAPHPEIAKRFIEFTLTEEAQALWQFHIDEQKLGPTRFELRRMPIRRVMYEKYLDRFVDRVNPFDLASPARFPNPNVRSFIPVLFSAMVMDNHRYLQQAWDAIVNHPAYPESRDIVTAVDVNDPELKEMLMHFDAMPVVEGPNGSTFDLADPEVLGEVKAGWLKRGWEEYGMWSNQAEPVDVLRRKFAKFYREKYVAIVRMAEAPIQ